MPTPHDDPEWINNTTLAEKRKTLLSNCDFWLAFTPDSKLDLELDDHTWGILAEDFFSLRHVVQADEKPHADLFEACEFWLTVAHNKIGLTKELRQHLAKDIAAIKTYLTEFALQLEADNAKTAARLHGYNDGIAAGIVKGLTGEWPK